jgi:hypothetical protein
MGARDRYLALLREGEALNLTYNRLGTYIAERLEPTELRELYREYAGHHDQPHHHGGSNDHPGSRPGA